MADDAIVCIDVATSTGVLTAGATALASKGLMRQLNHLESTLGRALSSCVALAVRLGPDQRKVQDV